MTEQEVWDKYKDCPSLKNLKMYVYYQRVNAQGELMATDEMNLWERIDKQRTSEKNFFKFVRLIDLEGGIKTAQVSTSQPQVVDDPLQCPLCGMVAKTEASLKRHKTMKHG